MAQVLVLEDISAIFTELGVDRVTSAELVERLVEIETRPWGDWSKGNSMTARQLARLLAPFKIAPASIRTSTSPKTSKGYKIVSDRGAAPWPDSVDRRPTARNDLNQGNAKGRVATARWRGGQPELSRFDDTTASIFGGRMPNSPKIWLATNRRRCYQRRAKCTDAGPS